MVIKKLGPGLLWAGAAIGVSHLVQSTTAGANYGFTLLWAVLFANLIKYPFFEFGLRYSVVTQENLLRGYQRLGNWTLWLFMLLTLGTIFSIVAAITSVTAGLTSNLFGGLLPPRIAAILLLVVIIGILSLGKYKILDNLIKLILVVLAICTITAAVMAFLNNPTPMEALFPHFTWQEQDIFFLVALIGWMPSPIDNTIWHTLWIEQKAKQLNHYPTLAEARFDFNVSYITTTVLAICFLALGAFVLYGSSEPLATQSLAFSITLINTYTLTLGKWSYWIISIAAFTTMFSTTLTVLDAAPRSLQETTSLLFKNKISSHAYWYWLGFILLGSCSILLFFQANMRTLITIATTLSFLTAPILGFLNYHMVTHEHVPKELQPRLANRLYSSLGLLFLAGFSVYYLWILFD